MKRLQKEKIRSVDRSGMFEKMLELPDQLLRGWGIGAETDWTVDLGRFTNVVFGGMGGSAIAGDLVGVLLGDHLPVPLVVNRGYRLPGFAGPTTLFVASSYSGNTEETLSATQEAADRGCSVVCVTSGGHLGEIAETEGYPVFRLPSGYPPRAALGYSLGVCLRFFRRLGIGETMENDLSEAVSFLRQKGKLWVEGDGPDNLPLSLAEQFCGRIPLMSASVDRLAAVGLRWKTQLNENSKTHAFHLPFPEMNHNEIVGWERLKETEGFFSRLLMVLLRDPEDYPRLRLRMEVTKRLVAEDGGEVVEVMAEGVSLLTRLLYLVHLGDLLSFYLAILYGVDPTEIRKIDALKRELDKSS